MKRLVDNFWIVLIVLLSISNNLSAAEPVLADLGQTAVDANGNIITGNAHFFANLTIGTSTYTGGTFPNNPAVDVAAKIQVAPEQIGQLGVLFVVAQYNGAWYMKTATGWTSWDLTGNGLQPTGPAHALTAIVDIDVVKQLNLVGSFRVLIGYRSQGILHYGPQSLTFSLEPGCTPLNVLQGATCVEPFALTVTKLSNGGGSGSIVSNPPGINCSNVNNNCAFNFSKNTSVDLTATPDSNAVFSGWSGACTNSTGSCTVILSEAKNVFATFSLNTNLPSTTCKPPTVLQGGVCVLQVPQFSINAGTLSYGGGKGSVSFSPVGTSCGTDCYQYAQGTLITLTAIPNTDAFFRGWSSNKVNCESSSCTFTVTENVSIAAEFAQLYTLNVATTGNGAGKITHPGNINCGAGSTETQCSASFAINSGITLKYSIQDYSVFTGWGGDCSGVLLCNVKMDAAKTVTANFNKAALNDTGFTTCLKHDGISCPMNYVPGQDADYGRDLTHNDDKDGHAGFSFTKIQDVAGVGITVAADAKEWHCVKDNVTGLVWEVKTDDSGLHDKDWTYTWYEPDSTKNGGGGAGTQNGGQCGNTSACDTFAYVQAVNTIGWCGYNDWRLPTVVELQSILDLSRTSPPRVDINFFRISSARPVPIGLAYLPPKLITHGASTLMTELTNMRCKIRADMYS